MMLKTCACCGRQFESARSAKKFCSHSCANKAAADERTTNLESKDAKIVWSSGGGIQSTAIAVLIWQGRLPKPDFAFMADVGFESERTIRYIDSVVKPRLREVGLEFNLVDSSNYVDVQLVDDKGNCNIPAFRRNADGSVDRLSTRCNGTWKQTVLRKWLRERGVEKCVDWVGISTDESRRAHKNTGLKWIQNAYPLIEMGLSRKDCVQNIKDAGWPMPLRSSCVICPLRTKFEWLRLKVDCPEDFERACDIEREIQRVAPGIFLTPQCRPLREVVEYE